MKTLIYIGNKSGVSKHANMSSIDILGRLLEESGYKIYYASSKKNIVLRLLHMLWVCFKYSNRADYVLIDTYSTLNFYYAYFVSQMCRLLHLKYIPILHGGKLPNRLQQSPKLSKAIFNHAYKNVSPSKYIKSKFEAFGYKNLICIPNSIELGNYKFKKREFDEANLLWVRSFSEIYNPFLGIKVLKALKDESINAKLCMVGPDSDGSLQKAKNYANELQVEVIFTGKLDKKEWINLSENYNIFINTTHVDNMPVSIIESWALGLPVVSTNVGGIPFFVKHNENGILVEPNMESAFVDAIKKLISSKNYGNKIAEEARRCAENLDWNVVKNHWIKVLN